MVRPHGSRSTSIVAALLLFEALSAVALFLASIVLLILLFLKRRVFPKLIVWFYGFALLVVIIDSVIVLVFGPDMVPDASLRDEAG